MTLGKEGPNSILQREGPAGVRDIVEMAEKVELADLMRADEALGWKTYRPLPALGIQPGPDVSLEILPPVLGRFVGNIAARMQALNIAPLAPALVALSSVHARAIQPNGHDESYIERNNIFGALVAPPGSRKTPIVSAVLDPLRAVQAEMWNADELEHPSLMARKKTLEAEKSSIESAISRHFSNRLKDSSQSSRDITPDSLEAELAECLEKLERLENESQRRELIVNDVTPEKLLEQHSANPHGLLLHVDELAGLLSPAQKYKEAQRADLLTAWLGSEPYSVGRKTSRSFTLDCLRISTFGTTQPAVLTRLRTDQNLEDDGLLQRFQAVAVVDFPEATAEETAPDLEAREAILGWIRTQIDNRCRYGPMDYPVLRFSPTAQQQFSVWRLELDNAIRARGRDGSATGFDSYRAKQPGFVARLAALFCTLEDCTAAEVTLGTLNQAIAVSETFTQHAQSVFAASRALRDAHTILDLFLEGVIEDGVRVRDIYKKVYRRFLDRDHVAAAVSILEKHGIARLVRVPPEAQGGRPSTEIRLRPGVLGVLGAGHAAQ